MSAQALLLRSWQLRELFDERLGSNKMSPACSQRTHTHTHKHTPARTHAQVTHHANSVQTKKPRPLDHAQSVQRICSRTLFLVIGLFCKN